MDEFVDRPSVQHFFASAWRRQVRSSTRFTLVIVCVILLIYSIITIVGLDKLSRSIDVADKQRTNFEKLFSIAESLDERMHKKAAIRGK